MVSHMYPNTKTWNPFVGCYHDCKYCFPSFHRQVKRWGKRHCFKCYNYVPHAHPERLSRIPNAENVFVCGNSDLRFAPVEYLEEVALRVAEHAERHPETTYIFQSKAPSCFIPILHMLPKQAVIVTTLETNRNFGYRDISRAPLPTVRYVEFKELPYPRKAVTVEPILDFDLKPFADMLLSLKPEWVWVGYNSKPSFVRLPEPPLEKTLRLIGRLRLDVEVRVKMLRGETGGG